MKKKIMVVLALMIAAVMLFGACKAEDTVDTATPGPVVDNEANIVVAEVNGEPIYYDEYYAQYVRSCSSQGVPENDETYGPIIKQMVLDDMVGNKVLLQKVEELGYMDMTDEKLAEVTQEAQDFINDYVEYQFSAQIEEELGEDYTDEEKEAVYAKYEQQVLESSGVEKQDFIDDYINSVAVEAANEDLTKDIEPTEDEIKAEYDECVAADKETFEEDAASYVSQSASAYYVPAGVRRVLQVLIAFDEETQNAINLLRSEGFDDAAELVREDALSGIKEIAEERLDKIESGEITFEEASLSEEYNDDTGRSEDGYPVIEGTEQYVEEFTEGAMALENIGDMSGLIATDFGYHILKYIADTPEGAVEYDSVHDDIAETLKVTMKSDTWNDLLAQWKEEADIVPYEENM